LRLIQIFRQSIEVQRQIAEPIVEVHIAPNIQRDVVVVNRILDQPIPTRVAIVKVSLAEKLSIGNINEIVRDRDADLHRLGFVFPLVFVRPPDAGAFALASREDPWPAKGILAESETTEPARS